MHPKVLLLSFVCWCLLEEVQGPKGLDCVCATWQGVYMAVCEGAMGQSRGTGLAGDYSPNAFLQVKSPVLCMSSVQDCCLAIILCITLVPLYCKSILWLM
uniref:Secreted protein n=1 Tax=Eutreptiella gymnastica TaxID=73025 RepID=A0A7S1NS92_9EUGL